MNKNKNDLFDTLPLPEKFPQEFWDKVSVLKTKELMEYKENRWYSILELRRRFLKNEKNGVVDTAKFLLERCKTLLGVFVEEGVSIDKGVLSMEYISRPNAIQYQGDRIEAGTWDEHGQMYLPGPGGGKGEFVPPPIFFRDRPIHYLFYYWNSKTRGKDRAKLLKTNYVREIIGDVENKFNITLPPSTANKLSNKFEPRT